MTAIRLDELKEVLSLPNLWDVITHGDQADRRRYEVGMAAAGLLLAASLVLSLGHQRALLKAPATSTPRLRGLYQLMHLFPLVVALAAFMQVAAPSFAVPVFILQEIWEALALHYFGLTIICLLGGEEATVRRLADHRGSLWRVPPCGCLVPLMPCLCPDAPFDAAMLAKMRWMVEQFCYVTPLTALLGAALDREQNYQKHLHAAQGAVQVMRLASMFICLQALFALYMLSHHALQKYKTTAKFLSIKALILLSVLQKALVMLALHAGVIGLHPSRLFTEADAALRLQAFLLLAEVPFLQVLVNRAFPAEELSASDLLEPLA